MTLSTALGLLFIGLKLTGYINWSWIWVLSPFWLGFAVFFTILAIGTAIGARMSVNRK